MSKRTPAAPRDLRPGTGTLSPRTAMPTPTPTPPLGLAQALDRSEPLAGLLRRLHQARALFETIAPLLPPALHADVRPGPVDGERWTLLATAVQPPADLFNAAPTNAPRETPPTPHPPSVAPRGTSSPPARRGGLVGKEWSIR